MSHQEGQFRQMRRIICRAFSPANTGTCRARGRSRQMFPINPQIPYTPTPSYPFSMIYLPHLPQSVSTTWND